MNFFDGPGPIQQHDLIMNEMDQTWSDEVHKSRYAAELAVAHEEIYLKKQNLPVPINHAAKSGGPLQSLLLLGGIGALAMLKLWPNQTALKQFIHDHPIMWSPINTLFSGGGRSLGGSSQGQSQPKAPRGGREAASKAAKAAAQAAAARAAAAVVPLPVKNSSASSSSKVTSSPSKIPLYDQLHLILRTQRTVE